LQSQPSLWKKVFKALSLLDHLVKNGSERVVEDARDHMPVLRRLSDFRFYEGPKDVGNGVREKSKQIKELLQVRTDNSDGTRSFCADVSD
jgi:epsin